MNCHRAILGSVLLVLAAPVWAADTGNSIAREALRGITYRPSTAAPPARALDLGPQPGSAEATTLAPVKVQAWPSHLFRAVNEAEATSNLLAPCMLYTRDLKSGSQLQALGAPVKPWDSDPRWLTRRPIFPLVALAW